MKLPLGPVLLQSISINSRFRGVSRYLLTPLGCVETVSGSNVKEFPSILYTATAKESNCQKRDLTYLYKTQKT